MSYSNNNPLSYHSNHVADDSSTVFDADTVIPDKVPSLPAPAMPPLTVTATTTDYLYNNINESTSSTSIQEESPANTISELLRRIKSQRSLAEPSTTTATATATATRSEEISTNESSSSSSKKRTITNNSSHQSTKRSRQSSRLKRQSQTPDRSYVDKSDSEVEDENEVEDYEPDEAVINQTSSSSSQTSTTKLTKFELKWKSKFEELRAYKRSNGHVNVPQRNKELGVWVAKQRTEYKKLKDNKYSCMTKERIDMLESIGFEWVGPKIRFAKDESKWNKRFNELKAYKEKYGRTNVPKRWEVNKQLGAWVKTQRAEYRKFKKNGKGKITNERIQILESIGFEWVSPNKAPARNESAWNKRFNELKEYKENYERTNVTISENKQLGAWVRTQRKEYKKFQENKKSQITKERIEMLKSIGFQWECRPGRTPRS